MLYTITKEGAGKQLCGVPASVLYFCMNEGVYTEEPTEHCVAYFRSTKLDAGDLRTSRIQKVEKHENILVITTKNSVYKATPVAN